MCGITGIFDLNGIQIQDRQKLTNMTNALKHRGPDGEGYFFDQNIALGFRRLSFMDLENGNQPVFSKNKKIVSVMNGEIYNYEEFKSDLINKGYILHSQCDAEILPHLYEEYGTDFIAKLNGQFSFAIYDIEKSKIILARDHVGITPLFYHITGKKLTFASEIKAIIKHNDISKDIDLVSLDQIMTFPSLVSPRTIFKDVKSLPAGHLMIIDADDFKITSYWDLNYPEENSVDYSKPESFYIEKLDELIQESVKRRLNSDVSMGFYLSGGIDSSLIAGIAKYLQPVKQYDSFSMGFEQEEIDERIYQRIIVNNIESRHHEMLFDLEQIKTNLTNAVIASETPLKETYNACSLALSERVRMSGVKGILSGEGADELFAGYVGYHMPNSELNKGVCDLEQELEKDIRSRLWGDANFFYERNYHEFKSIKQSIYSDNVNISLTNFDSTSESLIDVKQIDGRHPIHRRSYIDFKLRIADHLVADHGDRVAMANSVETRYPFLDQNVINFVRTIPPNLLAKGGSVKYLLKKIAPKYIPQSIINRKKLSFVAPSSADLIKNQPEWILDMLSNENISRQGIFNPKTVDKIKELCLQDNFNINQTFETDFLMIIITTCILLDNFI